MKCESSAESGWDWANYSRSQKIVAATAGIATLARPVLTGVVARRGYDKEHKWRRSDTVLMMLAAISDLEGCAARAANIDCKTGEIIDRLADRVSTFGLELILVRRNQESALRYGVNAVRTLGIIGTRQYVRSNRLVNDFDFKPAKSSAFVRYASNIFAVSPIGEKHPRLREGIQTITTIANVATGIADTVHLLGRSDPDS